MTEDNGILQQNSKDNKRDLWFEDFISTLQSDKLQLELDVLAPEKKEMYESFIFGDFEETSLKIRTDINRLFVSNMLMDYIHELKNRDSLPKKIAFDLSGTKVLVWAEINNDDENAEYGLIISEAKINAKYSSKGFGISSTIVEEFDKLKTPPQYKPLEIRAL